MYDIKVYATDSGKAPFLEWLNKLPPAIRARMSARIARFENGNLGDHKKLSKALYEARMFFGPGYRVYFAIIGRKVILLLAGGDKSSQKKDIEKAKEYLKDYLEDQDA